MKTVESSKVFQPKQWAEKKPGRQSKAGPNPNLCPRTLFEVPQYHFPLFREMAGRTVTTLHGRQELPDLKSLFIGFSEMPLVSISSDQRRSIAKANFSRPYITEFRRTCTRQNSARRR
jgi:hypothetical protein